jgi:serine/threonine-protein kinase RsbW
LQPADAPGVTACVKEVYGDSYAHRALYDPEQIVRMNRTGELVSIVAVHGESQVVGHYALERPDLGRIAEEGEALVLPEHRHEHLMECMRGRLEEEAQRLSLTGVFGRAVTNHCFTQKVQERFSLHPCALSLGVLPKTFHNMPQALPQRLSLLLAFKYLVRPKTTVAGLPSRHQGMCQAIYDQFGVSIEPPPAKSVPAAGEVDLDVTPGLQMTTIRVRTVGVDTPAKVGQARRDLCDRKGIESIILEMPLAQSGTAAACEELEKDGFFFSGIGPDFAVDGDALRLQHLTTELDVSLLQIEKPFARELVSYVASERERTSRVSKGRS